MSTNTQNLRDAGRDTSAIVCAESLSTGPSADALPSECAAAVLRAHAEGRINHVFNGRCPGEVQGHEVRDDKCTVCRALIALQKGEPRSPLELFDPEVLSERLRDVAASNFEAAMAFGISRDSFERCANDAAKVMKAMTRKPENSSAQDAARWRAYSALFPELSAAFVAVNRDAAVQFDSFVPKVIRISGAMVKSARHAYDKAPFPELNKWRRALDAAISVSQFAVADGQKKMRVTAAMVRTARDAYNNASLPDEDCWNWALLAAFFRHQQDATSDSSLQKKEP